MTPGQAAYEKWRNLLLGKDAHWDRLRDSDKAHWEEVAQAAIDAYKTSNVIVPHAAE